MLDNFRHIYDSELRKDIYQECPTLVALLERSEVRAFVYEICKRVEQDKSMDIESDGNHI